MFVFQCLKKKKSKGVKRQKEKETPAKSFQLNFKSAVLSSPFVSELLPRKVMPGSVRRAGLRATRKAEEACSHSVVGVCETVGRSHFRPCCVSRCLLKSTFLWKPLPHRSQPKGLKPVCLRLWVMRLEL